MSFDFRLLTFDFCITIYKKRANLQLFFDMCKSLCFFRLLVPFSPSFPPSAVLFCSAPAGFFLRPFNLHLSPLSLL